MQTTGRFKQRINTVTHEFQEIIHKLKLLYEVRLDELDAELATTRAELAAVQEKHTKLEQKISTINEEHEKRYANLKRELTIAQEYLLHTHAEKVPYPTVDRFLRWAMPLLRQEPDMTKDKYLATALKLYATHPERYHNMWMDCIYDAQDTYEGRPLTHLDQPTPTATQPTSPT